MTREQRLLWISGGETARHLACAMESDDERHIDRAMADFDKMIEGLDTIQRSNSRNALRASQALLRADRARQAILDTWAEA